MFKDEKINYTNYLRDKPRETDPAKLRVMKARLVMALKDRDAHGHISAQYYQDGTILVHIDGEYYGVFDSGTRKFFSGYVGD